MLQGRYDQDAYDYARKQLALNLDCLFLKYRGMVEGENADALINVINTGKRMLSEIHFLYCPPIVLDFIIGKMDPQQKENNYHAATDMYHFANELISQLLEDKPDAHTIETAKRALNTTVRKHLSEGDDLLDTAANCCSAFYNALVTFGGIALMVIGAVLAPTSLGASLGLVALGLFATGLGATRLVASVKAINETGKVAAKDFSEAAGKFSELSRPKIS